MGARATAIFDADDSLLSRAFTKIDRQLKDAEKKFAFLGNAARLGISGAAAATATLGVGVIDALNKGGEELDKSFQTGNAIDQLMVLEQEFKNAGKGAEDVGKLINKMQNNIASGAVGDLLTEIGVDFDALKKKVPVDQFHEIGTAIAAIPSPTDRAAAAMKIFGKEGATLLSLFASQGFGEAAGQVGEQAQILARDAALFDDVSDKLALAGVKTQGFFIGVADRVAPVLKPLLDKFATLDLAKQGQDTGDAIAMALQSAQDGNLGEILGLTVTGALLKAGNLFVAAMLSGVGMIGKGLMEMVGFAGKHFAELANPAKLAVDIARGNFSTDRLEAELTSRLSRVSATGSQLFNGRDFFDASGIDSLLSEAMSRSLTRAAKAQENALLAVPTAPPEMAANSLAMSGYATPNVSALTEHGGNVGASGFTAADPLNEANSIARDMRGTLVDIYNAIIGRSYAVGPGGGTFIPAYD